MRKISTNGQSIFVYTYMCHVCKGNSIDKDGCIVLKVKCLTSFSFFFWC